MFFNKSLLLLLVGMLLLGIPATAAESDSVDVVSPYDFDFNNMIADLSDANNFMNDPAFKVAAGWGHIVDTYQGWLGPRSVPYYYLKNEGVLDTRCLYVDQQYQVKDYSTGNPIDTHDAIVTPPVSGKVSIAVKQRWSLIYGQVHFYKVNEENGKLTLGEELHPDQSLTDQFQDFTFNVAPHTRIGIVGSKVNFDNFHADSAEIPTTKTMMVTSIVSNNPQYVDCNADGNYTVSYNVTVANNGETDLLRGEDGLSVDLIHKNTGKVVASEELGRDLYTGDYSKPIKLSATLSLADYPESEFIVRENISGTTKSAGNVKPYPYKPSVALVTYTDEPVDTTEEHFLGITKNGLSDKFTLTNDGASPMEITSVKLPDGYSTTLQPQTVAPHQSLDFRLRLLGEGAGDKRGNLTISANNMADYNLPIGGYVVAKDTWFEDFEDNKTPADMADQSNGNWKPETISPYLQRWNNGYSIKISTDAKSKLISPLLNVADGEVLTFDAARNDDASEVKVYYSADLKNWTLLRTLSTTADNEADRLSDRHAALFSSSYYEFLQYKIANIPAGKWYIAFESNDIQLDNIFGFKAEAGGVIPDNDFSLVSADIPETATRGAEYTAHATVQNNSIKDMTPKSYKAQLHFGDNVVDVDPVTIHTGEKADFDFTFTPYSEGDYPVFVTFSAGNNYVVSSDTVNVEVVIPGDRSEVAVGEDNSYYFSRSPLVAGQSKSQSEAIYTEDVLTHFGLAKGQSILGFYYKGYISYGDGFDVDLQAWFGKTTDDHVDVNADHDTKDLTQLADGLVTIEKQEGDAKNKYNYLEFDFDKPFVYDGGNLIVRVNAEAGYGEKIGYLQGQGDNRYKNFAMYRCANNSNQDLPGRYTLCDLPVIYLIVSDSATGIHTIAVDPENAPVYTVNGMRVNDKNLPAGIYIKNGKKFVVK